MHVSRGLGLGVISGLVILACVGLKRGDEPAFDADASVTSDASNVDVAPGPHADGSTVDAGPPPVDFSCGRDAWTAVTKTRPECAPRQVTLIDGNPGPLEASSISIARTKAGRIGISYYSAHTSEEGELRVAHFLANAAAAPFVAHVVKRFNGPYSQAGYANRIAATAPDTLEVLTHDVESAANNGDLNVVSLVNGLAPLGSPTTVATGLRAGAQVAFASDGAGTLLATMAKVENVDGGTGTTGRLSARRKLPGAAFLALPDIASGLAPDQAPEVGSASLVIDNGQLHLVFHHSLGFAFSTPRYHTFDETAWTYRKTLDNNTGDGLAGFSPRLGVFGTTKVAAFFFKKGGQLDPRTAELRLATWQAADDMPTIEVVVPGFPSPDRGGVAAPPNYRVAMAIDPFGLVHLAYVQPNNEPATRGGLYYRRQTKAADGTVTWLEDTVDSDVLAAGSDTYVDLLVDESARPHIAYRSGKDSNIWYATRLDR